MSDPLKLKQHIRDIPDFPTKGILFRDITPVLADPRLFAGCIRLLTSPFREGTIDAVVGIDARGFIFASGATSGRLAYS